MATLAIQDHRVHQEQRLVILSVVLSIFTFYALMLNVGLHWNRVSRVSEKREKEAWTDRRGLRYINQMIILDFGNYLYALKMSIIY